MSLPDVSPIDWKFNQDVARQEFLKLIERLIWRSDERVMVSGRSVP
jgi:hypothetical protein